MHLSQVHQPGNKCTNRAISAPTERQVHQPSNKCTNRATSAPTEQQLFLKVCLCEKSAISPSRRVMRCRIVGGRLADSSFIYQLSTSRHSIFIIFIRLIISILNNDGINNLDDVGGAFQVDIIVLLQGITMYIKYYRIFIAEYCNCSVVRRMFYEALVMMKNASF